MAVLCVAVLSIISLDYKSQEGGEIILGLEYGWKKEENIDESQP